MDSGTKKKSEKGGFDAAVKGNEEIRRMMFHKMTFDELEESFETNISESMLFKII